MTITNKNQMSTLNTPVQQFYAGQSILITGGTGLLGKVLVEKLLRSCPDLSLIYLIIRAKKGKGVYQRLDAMLNQPLFDLLSKEMPKFRNKIRVIAGDCSLPGLGVSEADRELILREVTIIFNVAATVRFDETIKEAVAINVQGTKEVLNLSRQLHNLKVFVHVSTAYSNCIKTDIEEKFYDSPMTGDNVIKLMQILDEKKLDAITSTLLGDFPNTYTFTKNIAEQLVLQYGRDLPIGVFRPAMITSSVKEPLSGWIDHILAPSFALVMAYKGLVRIQCVDEKCKVELVPVDYIVNALISSAWDIANNKRVDADPPIYNCKSSWTYSPTWGEYTELALKHGNNMPTTHCIWRFSMISTKNLYMFHFLTFIFHIIPAILFDTVLFFVGKKAKFLDICKKMYKYQNTVLYFGMRSWKFSNKNVLSLWDKLSPEDKDIFFFSMKDFDWDAYMYACIMGIRTYIFKDTPDTIPKARKRMSRLTLLDKVIKYACLGLLFWGLYSIFLYALSS